MKQCKTEMPKWKGHRYERIVADMARNVVLEREEKDSDAQMRNKASSNELRTKT